MIEEGCWCRSVDGAGTCDDGLDLDSDDDRGPTSAKKAAKAPDRLGWWLHICSLALSSLARGGRDYI